MKKIRIEDDNGKDIGIEVEIDENLSSELEKLNINVLEETKVVLIKEFNNHRSKS